MVEEKSFQKNEPIESVKSPLRKIKCKGCNSWREDVYYTFQGGDLCTDCLRRKYQDFFDKNTLEFR
jgi:hypothetical protein